MKDNTRMGSMMVMEFWFKINFFTKVNFQKENSMEKVFLYRDPRDMMEISNLDSKMEVVTQNILGK